MQAPYIWKKPYTDASKGGIKHLTNIPNKDIFLN